MEQENLKLKYLEAAKQPFRSRLFGTPRIVEVPEWPIDGAPMKFFIWPLTLREIEIISSHDTNFRRAAATIVVRAKDEARRPRFDPLQLEDFMSEVDPDQVIDIAKRINAGDQSSTDVEGES